jgi:acyl-coenzyme A thioesterase PaaI-like protein
MRFGVVVETKHLNIQGRTHGGMLCTYFDNALGWAVMDATGFVPCVTVQLGVQFIAGGKHGEFIEARTRIVRKTRSMVFAEGSLYVGDTEIATASGVWKIISAPTAKLQPAI